jgi:hypothetical protein
MPWSSVPATHFDAALEARVTREWCECIDVLAVVSPPLHARYERVSGVFLMHRLRALIDSGTFEGRGDFSEPWSGELRRAT